MTSPWSTPLPKMKTLEQVIRQSAKHINDVKKLIKLTELKRKAIVFVNFPYALSHKSVKFFGNNEQ